MHNVEGIHDQCYLLIASGNLFRNMSNARETAVSRASLVFQKRFSDAVCS